MKNKIRPFHFAFPVYDIDKTTEWYVEILNCSIGRQSRLWVDIDFFGHQISAHKISEKLLESETDHVDGHNILSRHFEIVMEM